MHADHYSCTTATCSSRGARSARIPILFSRRLLPQSRVPCAAPHGSTAMMSLRPLFGLSVLTVAWGHGALVEPISRNAVDREEVGCDANTDTCSSHAKGDGCVNVTHPGQPCHNGQASFWYSQGCFIGCPECDHLSGRRQTDLCGLGKKATLPDYARSVNRKATRFSEYDIYQHNPWSAPGSAPVADACGLAGGSPWDWNRAEAGNYVNTSNARHGMNGTSLPHRPTGTAWKIGGEAQVSWQVRNNRENLLHKARASSPCFIVAALFCRWWWLCVSIVPSLDASDRGMFQSSSFGFCSRKGRPTFRGWFC